jgi:dTDP-4-dehydrorhamnose 3,5-epimerase
MSIINQTSFDGVLLLQPKKIGDERGYFLESFNAATLAGAGFTQTFVQDNQSSSQRRGTVRGLHFQAPPRAQDKLIRVLRGSIFDVAVDIRIGSPSFGKSVSFELTAENGRQLLIPKGFAHGFQTLEDNTEVFYKVTDGYAPETEGGLLWQDASLAIQWPIDKASAIVNARDSSWPTLATFTSPFSY